MNDKKKTPAKDETCRFLRTLADKIETMKIPKSKIRNIIITKIDDPRRPNKDFEAVIYTAEKSSRGVDGGRVVVHAQDCPWG